MPPSFVIAFSALLLFGPHLRADLFVAAVAALTPSLRRSPRNYPLGRMLAELAIALTAIEAAGMTNTALGGTIGGFAWPSAGSPRHRGGDRVSRHPGHAGGSRRALGIAKTAEPIMAKARVPRLCALHGGASIAAALAEAIGHRMWQVLPVVVASLYFVYRTYVDTSCG